MIGTAPDHQAAAGLSVALGGRRAGTHRDVWTRAVNHGLFVFVPLLVIAYILSIAIGGHHFAVDFRSAFWPAGNRVLAGLTPYASPHSIAASHGFAFVYPAPGALLFAAFAWIPLGAAGVLFTLICAAAALGALWLCGVRDWRLYGLTLILPPVISGWQTANLSLVLAFGIAVAWRYRDRPAVAGIAVGLVASLKIFLWPLGLWLLLTRRWRALGWAAAAAVAVNVVSWAALGLHQIGPYLRVVSAATKLEERAAYTPLALALRLGASRGGAEVVAVIVAVGCLAACILLARQGRDSAVLLGVITLSLLATPVVWIHYFVLLVVPLAIMRPRLSPSWALPLLLFACPVTDPKLWQLSLTLSVVAVLIAVLVRTPALAAGRGGDPRPDSARRSRPLSDGARVRTARIVRHDSEGAGV